MTLQPGEDVIVGNRLRQVLNDARKKQALELRSFLFLADFYAILESGADTIAFFAIDMAIGTLTQTQDLSRGVEDRKAEEGQRDAKVGDGKSVIVSLYDSEPVCAGPRRSENETDYLEV